MNEELPVSRRQALVVASAATAISVVAGVTNAGDSESKSNGERSRNAPPLKLKVTLTDGQVVTLKAAELVIDFGDNGQLLVKPNGFLPVRGNDSGDQSPKNSKDG